MSTIAEQVSTGRRPRLVAAAALVAAVAVAATFYVVRQDAEDAAPYDDTNATGALTLCSADGSAVTEGAVTDTPFADFVLGSSPTPEGYGIAGAVGSLFAHQPREGVAAEEYSGLQLTGSAELADPKHAAALVTKESTTLADFITAFPAVDDGFVQLRLIVSAPGAGTSTASYDSADIKIDGDRWQLVGGGSASCENAASALRPDTNS